MVQDRAIVITADQYKVVHDLSIGAIFDDFNDPLPRFQGHAIIRRLISLISLIGRPFFMLLINTKRPSTLMGRNVRLSNLLISSCTTMQPFYRVDCAVASCLFDCLSVRHTTNHHRWMIKHFSPSRHASFSPFDLVCRWHQHFLAIYINMYLSKYQFLYICLNSSSQRKKDTERVHTNPSRSEVQCERWTGTGRVVRTSVRVEPPTLVNSQPTAKQGTDMYMYTNRQSPDSLWSISSSMFCRSSKWRSITRWPCCQPQSPRITRSGILSVLSAQ